MIIVKFQFVIFNFMFQIKKTEIEIEIELVIKKIFLTACTHSFPLFQNQHKFNLNIFFFGFFITIIVELLKLR